MDPITLGIGLVGLGTSIFGGLGASSAAKKEAQVGQEISTVQQAQNDLRQQMMNIQGRRSQLETIRNTQRARAMAVSSAYSQGAQLGSGTQGGVAGVESQGAFGLQGINQNIQAGNQMFGFERQISGYKKQLSGLQSQASTDEGIASLGGALMKSAGSLGNLAGQAGGAASSLGSSIFGAVNSGGMLFQ